MSRDLRRERQIALSEQRDGLRPFKLREPPRRQRRMSARETKAWIREAEAQAELERRIEGARGVGEEFS